MNGVQGIRGAGTLRLLAPLAIFAVLVAFFLVGLKRDPRAVPSPLIDKPAPAFRLPQLHVTDRQFGVEDMRGQVWLLNVWASWCVTCLQEHPLFVDFAKQKMVPIVGLNHKDERGAALGWLQKRGNPYDLSVVDADGRVSIDYGVYGVPETFVIDKLGVVRYKHIGAVTQEALDNTIIPLIKKLQS
jgi:cytochrome c biogenesis protein CcmG, thiol:disulfide interchange protein DsbE